MKRLYSKEDARFKNWVVKNTHSYKDILIYLPNNISVECAMWYFNYCAKFEKRKGRIDWQNEQKKIYIKYPSSMILADVYSIEGVVCS